MTFQSGKHYTFGSYLDPTLVIELSTNDQKTISVRRVDDSHSNQKWLAHKSLAGHWCFRSLWKPFYIGIKATASEGDPLSAVEVPFYFQCIDIPQGENNSESGLVTLVSANNSNLAIQLFKDMPEDGTRLVLDSIVASGSDLQDGQAWVVKPVD